MAEAPCAHCKRSYTKARLKEHANECSEYVEACPGAAIGCQKLCQRGALDSHTSECPFAAILPCLQMMDDRISRQDAALSALRHRTDLYEANFDAMQEMLEGNVTALGSARPQQDDSQTLQAALAASSPIQEGETTRLDATTHHLLSMQESFREELHRVTSSMNDLDARTSMAIINENLRLREDVSRMNGAIGAIRMQLQWLMNARVNLLGRVSAPASTTVTSRPGQESSLGPGMSPRDSSDSSRQDTKL